nr:transposase [uncultured Lichenicoccus sp.]
MVEIITGVERRRRWRPEDKARILAETEEPGASIAIVARRHDISRGLLWHWRRAMHGSQAGLSSAEGSAFLPVTVVGDSRAAPQVPVDRSIEIMLPGGVCVRVGRGADLKVLRGVLTALRS